MTNEDIKEKIILSLTKLYNKDWYLLEKSVHERSLTHKLAEYMQELFPDYNVDCEYNLDIDDNSKRKKWVSEKAKNKLIEKIKKIKSDLNPENYDLSQEIDKVSTNFYPDIIVHKRGSNKCNLVIIEAKKHGNDQTFDEEKIIAFTEANGGLHHYKYQLGALIIFDDGDNFNHVNFTQPIFYVGGIRED